MKAIKYAGFLLLTQLILWTVVASAQDLEPEPRSQAEVMRQEELDNRRSKREGLRVPRSDWKEHENLPPPAHEMDWETEEGAL
ncbi:MAG: hypothetical protein JJU29_08860 [Verrucomicrobia bacterium]|nr:hypothetical protein [Verrucomicrobiota bacterium]MCH8511380.1 hypothetical protein [Kiritimatiellia bacterium]